MSKKDPSKSKPSNLKTRAKKSNAPTNRTKEIIHQPRLDDDPDLNKPTPSGGKRNFYYRDPKINDLLERRPDFLDYPETRDFAGDKVFAPVFPDEFVGTDCCGGSFREGKPIPNDRMPEVHQPETILGGEFRNSGNVFDRFLERLRQLCRNYNLDLYKLRQELFEVRINGTSEANLPGLVEAFNRSTDRLSAWLDEHDSALRPNGPFVMLAVEFVKINSYIASIRAGATERTGLTQVEVQYSSSSHISISSMFSSYYSSSSHSSP